MTNSEIIRLILIAEGGDRFTDHPADRGGPTKFGLTLETLSAHRGATVTAEDVRNLTEAEATEIYLEKYVIGPGFDKIPDDLLRWQVVDCGVLHGQSRATKWLQKILGVPEDGRLGPATLNALAGQQAHRIGLLLAAARVQFLGRLVSSDRSQAVFSAGWNARAAAFVEREAGR